MFSNDANLPATILSWFASLTSTGRVIVGGYRELSASEIAALETPLIDLDLAWRGELPSDAPPLDVSAASWTAVTLYHACQFLAHREVEGDEVARVLAAPPPTASLETCYSVDLTLRFLPDLIALARGVSEADPLVTGLMALAAAWPLSSVGVKGVGPIDVSTFIGDACLRTLYADRIIAAADASRLGEPRVDAALREAAGGRPDPLPRALAEALRPKEIHA